MSYRGEGYGYGGRSPRDMYDEPFSVGLRKDPFNTERERILELIDLSPKMAFALILGKLNPFSENRAYFRGKPVDIAYNLTGESVTGAVLTIKGMHSDTLYPVLKAEDDAQSRIAFFGSEMRGPYEVKLGFHYDPNKENPLTFGIAWEAFYHYKGGDTPAGNRQVGPELFVAAVFALQAEEPKQPEKPQRERLSRSEEADYAYEVYDAHIEFLQPKDILPKQNPTQSITPAPAIVSSWRPKDSETAKKRWERRINKAGKQGKKK